MSQKIPITRLIVRQIVRLSVRLRVRLRRVHIAQNVTIRIRNTASSKPQRKNP